MRLLSTLEIGRQKKTFQSEDLQCKQIQPEIPCAVGVRDLLHHYGALRQVPIVMVHIMERRVDTGIPSGRDCRHRYSLSSVAYMNSGNWNEAVSVRI